MTSVPSQLYRYRRHAEYLLIDLVWSVAQPCEDEQFPNLSEAAPATIDELWKRVCDKLCEPTQDEQFPLLAPEILAMHELLRLQSLGLLVGDGSDAARAIVKKVQSELSGRLGKIPLERLQQMLEHLRGLSTTVAQDHHALRNFLLSVGQLPQLVPPLVADDGAAARYETRTPVVLYGAEEFAVYVSIDPLLDGRYVGQVRCVSLQAGDTEPPQHIELVFLYATNQIVRRFDLHRNNSWLESGWPTGGFQLYARRVGDE